MNIYDILDLFKKLGIRCEINNNKVKFIDEKCEKEMIIWEDKTKEISLDNLKIGKYYTLCLPYPSKTIRFQLKHPIINGKIDENQIILERTFYEDGTNFHLIDLKFGREMSIEFKRSDNGEKDVTITDKDYISFKIKEGYGDYNNGTFTSYYQLSEEEMKEELSSNEAIQLFTEYYGKIYPGLLNTLNNVKSTDKSTTLK